MSINFKKNFHNNIKYNSKENNNCEDSKKSENRNFMINNDINIKENIIKKRNSGIDLVRILGMYSIIINHILYHGQVIIKYKKYKDILLLITALIHWPNNGFALISGIVGFKKYKYSNLLYLWICVVFYSAGIYFFFSIFKPQLIIKSKSKLIYQLFPIIFHRYWYFSKYFGLYLFFPLINKGIITLNKKELKLLIIIIISIFIIWKDCMNPTFDVFTLNEGKSVLWLLICYIIGAYIGKYNSIYYGKEKMCFNFVYIFIFIFSSAISYILTIDKTNRNSVIITLKNIFKIRQNSFPIILQSISITLYFMKIKYNNYISKIIGVDRIKHF